MPSKAKLLEKPTEAPALQRDSGRRSPVEERARLIGAAIAEIDRVEAPGASIDSICARARLPLSSFESVFGGREHCLVAVFDALSEIVLERARAAFLAGEQWTDGTRQALRELLVLADEHPLLARFILIEPCRFEPHLIPRLARLELSLAEALVSARPAPCSRTPDAHGPRASIGAVFAVLHARLAEEPVPPLRELAPPLTGMLVLPYLGAEGSREELTRGSARRRFSRR